MKTSNFGRHKVLAKVVMHYLLSIFAVAIVTWFLFFAKPGIHTISGPDSPEYFNNSTERER